MSDKVIVSSAPISGCVDNKPDIHFSVDAPTLRDQFAMAALTGMSQCAGFDGAPWNKLASDAYEAADAMLKAREEG